MALYQHEGALFSNSARSDARDVTRRPEDQAASWLRPNADVMSLRTATL